MEMSTEIGIRQWVENNTVEGDEDDVPLLANGFDEAIIGLWNNTVVYDKDICIEILLDEILEEAQISVSEIEDDTERKTADDAYLEAVEYFEYNVLSAYVGENGPIFIVTPEFIKEDEEGAEGS